MRSKCWWWSISQKSNLPAPAYIQAISTRSSPHDHNFVPVGKINWVLYSPQIPPRELGSLLDHQKLVSHQTHFFTPLSQQRIYLVYLHCSTPLQVSIRPMSFVHPDPLVHHQLPPLDPNSATGTAALRSIRTFKTIHHTRTMFPTRQPSFSPTTPTRVDLHVCPPPHPQPTNLSAPSLCRMARTGPYTLRPPRGTVSQRPHQPRHNFYRSLCRYVCLTHDIYFTLIIRSHYYCYRRCCCCRVLACSYTSIYIS